MSTSQRLVIIRHGPHASNALREGLDVALVAAAFGEEVSLLFMGQGVFALLKEQGAGAPGQKATLPTMNMLEMYDINDLWMPQEALDELSLTPDHLREGVKCLPAAELPALLARHEQVLTF